MGTVTVTTNVSLDGVMQSPGRPDEDTRGGFDRGGWGAGYQDDVMARAMGEGMARRGAILLGRRTYQDLFGYWPRQRDNPYTEVLNQARKYVASGTLTEPLPWRNSTLLPGGSADRVAGAVADLVRGDGPDLSVIGSGRLVQALRQRDLIDEYVLLIYPLVLGAGFRLFPDGPPADLRLVDSVPTTTGVIIARYRPTNRTEERAR